jgi:hypothetical protein
MRNSLSRVLPFWRLGESGVERVMRVMRHAQFTFALLADLVTGRHRVPTMRYNDAFDQRYKSTAIRNLSRACASVVATKSFVCLHCAIVASDGAPVRTLRGVRFELGPDTTRQSRDVSSQPWPVITLN